jgi:hypothetical protein
MFFNEKSIKKVVVYENKMRKGIVEKFQELGGKNVIITQ